MTPEREKELREQYSRWYTIQELFEEILRMESGDMWDGFKSKSYAEEQKLMISVFGDMLSDNGITWRK